MANTNCFLDYAGLELFWSKVKDVIENNELVTANAITNLDTRIDNLESTKSDIGHTHDDRYYTESEINDLLATKSNTNHTHTFASLTSKPTTISGYGITDALTTSNYTSYTVKKDGTGATGTWGINITGNAATATNADKLGNIVADNYFKQRDAVFNSDWDGKYLWTLWDNHLYAADKRFAVTLTGTGATNLSYLFDGCFESSVPITEDQAVLHIKHPTAGNVWTEGLPYGNFYVVFYNSDAENVTGRVYCNYDGQGIGWHDLTATHVRPHVWELNNGYYQLSDLEITITKPASSVSIQLCQVLHEVTRSAGPDRAAVMSKYCKQKTNYDIEAAGFIKTGGTSSQFLKADGSVDSNTYSKSDHTHDDRYYTESEINDLLANKSNTGHTHTKSQITDFAHTHDDRYYTESEMDTKLSTKSDTGHTHSFSEITPGVATIGDGANRLMFRTNSNYKNGIYYSTPGNEALVFGTITPITSWIFATTDPTTQTAWTSLTPSLQIKNGRVTINKLIANNTDASYNLDVNGSANATTLYENGVRVSVNGHTHDDRYYTESEIDTKLATKSNTGHTHDFASLTSKPTTLAGYGITETDGYLNKISKSGNTLTITPKDGTAFTFTNTPLVSITYSELKSLRDAGNLVPGQQYRITDYKCTTSQPDTQSAVNRFDIIVTADSESVLNEEARAIHHAGDYYFANNDLNAWKIWYCLDNDLTRFSWADAVVTAIELNDNQITCTYAGTTVINGTTYYLWEGDASVLGGSYAATIVRNPDPNDNDEYQTLEISADKTTIVQEWLDNISRVFYSGNGKGVIYRMIDEFNNDIPYDFKNIQFKHPKDTTTYPDYYYTFANPEFGNDLSCDIGDKCYSNIIMEYYVGYKRKLNCIIFIGSNCYNNTFNVNCYNNAFGSSCYNNTFGNGCYGNALKSTCNSNTFGDNCYSNTFGSSCKDNTFGDNCYSNTFGNSCSNNTVGNGCYSNTFDSYCSSNIFGIECHNNTFGSDCSDNTFGNSCSNNTTSIDFMRNTFGNSCYNNSFGSEGYNNYLGTGCNNIDASGGDLYNNTFDAYCQYIKFASDSSTTSTKYGLYGYNHFGNRCQYIVFTGAGAVESSADKVQNYTFAQGLQGTSSTYLTVNGERSRSYETKVAKNSNGELKIYCEADLIA